jgi:hypothetical protein
MSIVRVGLGETNKFAAGYDAIFGKSKAKPAKKARSAAKGKAKKRLKRK